jgi:hypothetical protein
MLLFLSPQVDKNVFEKFMLKNRKSAEEKLFLTTFVKNSSSTGKHRLLTLKVFVYVFRLKADTFC